MVQKHETRSNITINRINSKPRNVVGKCIVEIRHPFTNVTLLRSTATDHAGTAWTFDPMPTAAAKELLTILQAVGYRPADNKIDLLNQSNHPIVRIRHRPEEDRWFCSAIEGNDAKELFQACQDLGLDVIVPNIWIF